ncbi:MAG: hypothetical protein ABI778_12365, partial [Ignavibacteriota bacterium]
ARAFLLPMEEVSWQSRSAKGAAGILLILGICGFFLTPLGIETSGLLWFAAFMLIAGSYSRGPAVRRGAIDKTLRTIGFIAMLAAGIYNGASTNRGSEAASEVRQSAAKLIQGERATAKADDHIDNVNFYFVLDSALIAEMSSSTPASFSYSASSPLYLFGLGNVASDPGHYQPEGGILRRDTQPATDTLGGGSGLSPAKSIEFMHPEQYFDPRLRVLASLPQANAFSTSFGKYSHSFVDTTGVLIDFGTAKFRLVVGQLSPKEHTAVAEK